MLNKIKQNFPKTYADILKWYNEQKDLRINVMSVEVFKEIHLLPIIFQFAIIEKYFRDNNIYIHKYIEFYPNGINHLWAVLEYQKADDVYGCYTKRSTGLHGDNNEFPTYEIAIATAILTATEIRDKQFK